MQVLDEEKLHEFLDSLSEEGIDSLNNIGSLIIPLIYHEHVLMNRDTVTFTSRYDMYSNHIYVTQVEINNDTSNNSYSFSFLGNRLQGSRQHVTGISDLQVVTSRLNALQHYTLPTSDHTITNVAVFDSMVKNDIEVGHTEPEDGKQ